MYLFRVAKARRFDGRHVHNLRAVAFLKVVQGQEILQECGHLD